jgi:flagellin-specific chaperone FliS
MQEDIAMMPNSTVAFTRPLQDDAYLTQREVVDKIDAAMRGLKDVIYYCMVENLRARDTSLAGSKAALETLRDSIEVTDGNPVAMNLKNLLQFMLYSLATVGKNNSPAAAVECLAMLEPIRNALHPDKVL